LRQIPLYTKRYLIFGKFLVEFHLTMVICALLCSTVGLLKLQLFRCSVVFWFGDLNYRLDDIENEECKEKIRKGQLDDLWTHNDQVRGDLYWTGLAVAIHNVILTSHFTRILFVVECFNYSYVNILRAQLRLLEGY